MERAKTAPTEAVGCTIEGGWDTKTEILVSLVWAEQAYGRKLLALNPPFCDAYMTAGSVEYVVGSLPRSVIYLREKRPCDTGSLLAGLAAEFPGDPLIRKELVRASELARRNAGGAGPSSENGAR